MSIIDNRCVACGKLPGFCPGHTPTQDFGNWSVLDKHEEGNHEGCHPAACEVAREARFDSYITPTQEGD